MEARSGYIEEGDKMTDNDGYGLYTETEEDYKVYGKDGIMKEPYRTDLNNLTSGKITFDEYLKKWKNQIEGDEINIDELKLKAAELAIENNDYRCDACIKYPCADCTNYTRSACVDFVPEEKTTKFRVNIQEEMIEILLNKINKIEAELDANSDVTGWEYYR